MIGPLLTYDDELHLERLLSAARIAHIDVQPDPERCSAFRFRRGRGLVHGFRDWGAPGQLYFGFGHPCNPLLWSSDGRLLREIEQLFLTHGSRPITIDAAA